MRSTLFLLSSFAVLIAAVPLEARDHPMTGMTMSGTTTAAAHAMTNMPMRIVEHGKKGNDEKKKSSSMSMKKGQTMRRRDHPMTGMTMSGTTTAAAHAMTNMPMRIVEHGKKGNDEKKKSSSSMSMKKGQTMRVVLDDAPEATATPDAMAGMNMRFAADGDDDGHDDAAEGEAEPADAMAGMSMRFAQDGDDDGHDDAAEGAEGAEPADAMSGMNMRFVEHGKKGNDEKKATSTSKKAATKTTMVMKKGQTMRARAVADDTPATTAAPDMAGMNMRVVAHGKKGNDEKKATSTSKKAATKTTMVMKKGQTMHARAVADDAPATTAAPDMAGMNMRVVAHGKKGNDEKKVSSTLKKVVKTSSMSMKKGQTMHVRAMTMAPAATMDASMMKAHHPEWASMAADMKGMDMGASMTMAA